jgi:hypothetical protein
MQVERKQNWLPYVALFVGLLITCLWATLQWQSTDTSRPRLTKRAPVRSQPSAKSDRYHGQSSPTLLPSMAGTDSIFGIALVPSPGRWPLDTKKYGLPTSGSPTLDDLISTFNPSLSAAWLPNGTTTDFPLVVSRSALTFQSAPIGAAQWSNLHDAPPPVVLSVPIPRATAVVHHLREILATYPSIRIGKWLGESIARDWERYAEVFLIVEPIVRPTDAEITASDVVAPAFPAAESASPAPAWSTPEVLMAQLARLAEHPVSRRWATDTIAQLEAFLQIDRFNGDATATQLTKLSAAAQQAKRLAKLASDDRLRVELLRVHWGLARRIDRWSATHDIHFAALSQARLAARGEIGPLLHDLPSRTEVESLSADLEAYERTREPQLARQIVASQQALQGSSDALDVALADAVEQHYRNANVRFAITKDLLNRFVGEERSEWQPVRDRIAGTPVRGKSETLSDSRIHLRPATGRWQLAIEADGVVESNTTADGGQARVRSVGTTDFTAHKSVVVTPDGIHAQPSLVSANNYNRLIGVTTDFDWLPLFGSYARGRALEQYRAKRGRAKAEVESKVANRAADQLDERTAEALEHAKSQLRQRVTSSLTEAGVELTPIELTTTSQRLVARLRVAGSQQLAGHTPRPRAPADSLGSLQIHESALTNAAVSLALDGGRFSADELQAKLRDKLPQLGAKNPPAAEPGTFFQFADQDAVRFQITDGRLALALALVDFERDGRHVRNFVVHAYYVPVVEGLSAAFVRDGSLGIEGHLSSADRARLYSVFKEVLSEDRRLPIVQLNEPDERLAGLMITQLVLEDGWLGLAIGHDASGRVAERSRSLR